MLPLSVGRLWGLVLVGAWAVAALVIGCVVIGFVQPMHLEVAGLVGGYLVASDP